MNRPPPRSGGFPMPLASVGRPGGRPLRMIRSIFVNRKWSAGAMPPAFLWISDHHRSRAYLRCAERLGEEGGRYEFAGKLPRIAGGPAERSMPVPYIGIALHLKNNTHRPPPQQDHTGFTRVTRRTASDSLAPGPAPIKPIDHRPCRTTRVLLA